MRKLSTGQNISSIESNKPNDAPIAGQSSLFRDLPIPGDFGHGKFCICKDCRDKKELAATGSNEIVYPNK